MNPRNLLPAVRALAVESPEYFFHEPWELAHVLWSLGYVQDLPDEAELYAAVEVARMDYPQWWRAA
jgi:hypothetical protein